ncbi:MAG: extracellular solute-binding protein [Clostridiales bacterium]|nr:extracellular solute-binding protein [Clostridiales bacterium]
MSISKRSVISLMLIAAMAAGIVACGDKTPDDLGKGSNDADTSDTAPVEIVYPDLGGYEFIVNVRSESTGSAVFNCIDFAAEEQNGDVLNDAVYKRNQDIEQKYNCIITPMMSSGDQFVEISNQIYANDALEAGIVLGTSVAQLAQEGMLLNLYDNDNIDFTKSYWDQNAVDAFTIDGNMYFATGDNNLNTSECTRVTMFSKGIIEDFSLEDPYEIVNDGKWTFDKMLEMSLAANVDLNGDTKLTKDDQVGLYVYGWAPQYLFYGSGETVTKMVNGLPELTVYNDRSVEVVELIHNICGNSRTDTIGGWSGDQTYIFTADHCLFTQTSVWDLRVRYRTECEKDFGIIPIPKYNEEQDRYYNYVSIQDMAHLWCIPVTCSNYDYATILFEAFARESTDTTRKAYYDITLQGKITRDDASAEMLDLIFANRCYDMVALYNWGEWESYFSGIRDQGTNTFSSTYSSKLSKTLEDIDKTITSFRENSTTK